MKNLKLLIIALLTIGSISSCMKNNIDDGEIDFGKEKERVDSTLRAQKDTLERYARKVLTNPQYNDSLKMWFEVLAPATDNSYEYTISNGYFVTPKAQVKYKAQLLDGKIVDEPSLATEFVINQNSVVIAWLYAFFPKTVNYGGQTYHTGLVEDGLKVGHKIRFIAPSPWCYDKREIKDNTGKVIGPKDSPMDFTVEVKAISNAF